MQALIQRVSQAHVNVAGECIGQIGAGLVILLCVEHGDDETTAERLLNKILKLRIFSDEAGRMNLDVGQVNGGLLIVSQFTLAADVRKGNRPSFTAAADPKHGKELTDHFIAYARTQHGVVATGQFGADMQLTLTNDGPVTIPLSV